MNGGERFTGWRDELLASSRSSGRQVVLVDRVDSTHRWAERVIADSPEVATAPFWLFAFEQSAGVGRLDRRWLSVRGRGVYATFVTEVDIEMLGRTPMAVGVGLCRELRRAGLECALDWPNDLVVEGRKIGGVLVKSRVAGDRAVLTASFGVNHSQEPAELPAASATSMRLAGVEPLPSLSSSTLALAAATEAVIEGATPSDVLRDYRKWSVQKPGDRVAVREGGQDVTGELIDFTHDGHLELATPDGIVRLASGDGRRVDAQTAGD